MSKSKSKRKRRGGRSGGSRKRGGVMSNMRSGFRDVAGAVTGEDTGGKYKWVGRVITVLLLAAAIGLLAQSL